MRLSIEDGNFINNVFFRHAEIIDINYSEELADIVLVDSGEYYHNVPIFFHCSPESTLLPTGSLEGSSSAFKIGDLVFVYFRNGSPIIVGSLDKKKTCSSGCLWGNGLYSISTGKQINDNSIFIPSFEEDEFATHQQYVFSNTIELANHPITFVKHIHVTFRPYDFSFYHYNTNMLTVTKTLFIFFEKTTIQLYDDIGDYYIDFDEECIKIAIINDRGMASKLKLNPKGEIIDEQTYSLLPLLSNPLPAKCFLGWGEATYKDLKVHFYNENKIILYAECRDFVDQKPYFLTDWEHFPFITDVHYIPGHYKYAHIIFDKNIFTHQVHELPIIHSYSIECVSQNCPHIPPEVSPEGVKAIKDYFYPYIGSRHVEDPGYLKCDIYLHCLSLKCDHLEYECRWQRNKCAQRIPPFTFIRECDMREYDESCIDTGDGVFWVIDRYYICTDEAIVEGYKPYERQYTGGCTDQTGNFLIFNGTAYFYDSSQNSQEETFLLLQTPFWEYNDTIDLANSSEVILSFPYISYCYGELNIKNQKYTFSSLYQKERTGSVSFSFNSNFGINPPPYPFWVIGSCLVLQ